MKCLVEVEGVFPECIVDILNVVGPKDVDGDASEPCEDARIGTDATLILTEGGVADIVITVFNAPMPTNGSGGLLGGKLGRADIEGDLAPTFPKTGFGDPFEGMAPDLDRLDEIGGPFRFGHGFSKVEDFGAPIFQAGTDKVVALEEIGRFGGLGQGRDAFIKLLLVLLQLGQKLVPRLPGDVECFFDSAWHRL